jgi:ATP-dependent Clp protease adapter protein ClpS
MSTKANVREDVKKNVEIKEKIEIKIAPPRQYRVELANNETTSHEAVMDVLQNVFNWHKQRAYSIMTHAEARGFAICYINTKEVCEEKKLEAERYCLAKAGEAGNGLGGLAHYEDLEFKVEEHESE